MQAKTFVVCGVVLGGLVLASGCAEEEDMGLGLETWGQPLDAICTVNVQNRGAVEVETDYLAHVVACENGAADTEALKAQAVAARSYMYYKIRQAGASEIGDGQHDQVYTCGRPPAQRHYDAVTATSGQILRYNNTYVAAFYVAGAIPTTSTCIPASGDRDPTNTERYVTYNEGLSGTGIEQTSLGWVNAQNWPNRGCQSQNGANCLSQRGRTWPEILRFYYGEDIGITETTGSCVVDPEPPPNPCQTVVGSGQTTIDDLNACFVKSCQSGDWWWEHAAGVDGHVFSTYTVDQPNADCSGRWNLRFERGGDYTVEVHLVDPVNASARARYDIHHNGVVSEVVLSQRGVNGWAELGSFTFAANDAEFVELADNTGEPYTGDSSTRIIFDAIRVYPTPEDPGNNTGNNDPGNNSPSNNSPSNNTPSNNTPSNNTPSNNTPSNNTPSNNTPSNNTPSNNTPSNNTPSNNNIKNPNNNGLDPGPGAEDSGARVNGYEEGCSVAAPAASGGLGGLVLMALLGVVGWLRR